MEKTTAEKLQIKPNTTFWCSDARHAGLIGPLPPGVTLAKSMGEAGGAVLFAADAASLRHALEANRADLAKPAAFWVAYPKANKTDINRDSLWPILGEFGMRPNSQIAIDGTWSALRFRALKPGEIFNPGA
jgi:hypothetical protein